MRQPISAADTEAANAVNKPDAHATPAIMLVIIAARDHCFPPMKPLRWFRHTGRAVVDDLLIRIVLIPTMAKQSSVH
jgi:hypothetical protein